MVELAFEDVEPEPVRLGEPAAPLRDVTRVAPSVVDALRWPAETASWLTVCPVGPQAVAALAVIDPERVPYSAQLDLLVAGQRVQAWLAGLEQRILAACDATPEAGTPLEESARHFVCQEVAAALRLAPSTAGARLDTAAELGGALAATGAALARGELSYLHARAVVEETADLSEQDKRSVEAAVLPAAARVTVGEFRRRLRRAVTSLAPEEAEQRFRREYRQRRVTFRALPDGMASIWALLPADEAQAVYTALSALAERDADVPGPDGLERTRDQCRADALGRLGWQVLADPGLPRRHAARPTVTVAVALSTLLGCDQQPGQLTGYGPIPASMARRIAAEPGSTWRRLLVDPTGRPLDYGRTTYRPPADLRDFVLARDRQCVFPGCTRRARDTDLDHHRDWAAGGHTDADNLGPLCPLHHHLKHEAGWTVERRADGSVRWRSPTGRTYVNDPDPYPVDNWTEWQPGGAKPDRGAEPDGGAQPDRSAEAKCAPADDTGDDPPF